MGAEPQTGGAAEPVTAGQGGEPSEPPSAASSDDEYEALKPVKLVPVDEADDY